jgi:hypothetical protein
MSDTKISPRDHIFAVVPSRDAARTAISTLIEHGYPESVIFEGDDVTQEVDPKGENANPVEKVLKMIGDHLSEQPNYLSQYQEEARSGSTVLAVLVEDNNRVDAAKEILEQHGARNIRYFGGMAVSDLTPLSNPSTRSEESPESDKWSKQ